MLMTVKKADYYVGYQASVCDMLNFLNKLDMRLNDKLPSDDEYNIVSSVIETLYTHIEKHMQGDRKLQLDRKRDPLYRRSQFRVV